MKNELLKLALDSIDLEKLIIGSIKIAEKVAQDAAAKTPNPVDDAVEAIVFPAINPALEALIKKEVDALKASIASAV